jgi:hypothetical protein
MIRRRYPVDRVHSLSPAPVQVAVRIRAARTYGVPRVFKRGIGACPLVSACFRSLTVAVRSSQPQEPTGCPAFSNAGLARVCLYLLVSAPLQSRLGLGFLHRLIWRDAGLGGVRCDELAIARRFTAGAWPGPFLAVVLSS